MGGFVRTPISRNGRTSLALMRFQDITITFIHAYVFTKEVAPLQLYVYKQ